MGEWEITEELKIIIAPIIEKFLKSNDRSIDLSNTGINPLQLRDYIEFWGYEDICMESSGWEYNYCWDFINWKDDKKMRIVGTAMCHKIMLIKGTYN